MKQLDNKTTNYLISCSTPIGPKQDKHFNDELFKLTCWYHYHGLKANKVKIHWQKMSELLGFSWNFKRCYKHLTAIWGIEFEGIQFVIFLSLRGLNIQTLKSNHDVSVVAFLNKLLINQSKNSNVTT